MEMGKLTAKLRDAVVVCLLVDGKEIKRYKNIEIPDELKKLDYQEFKFDVCLDGSITFKIMFEPGVLPEEFPLIRERRTRKPLAQDAKLQEAEPATEVTAENESLPQDERISEANPATVIALFNQSLEGVQATGEPAENIIAMADGEGINAKIIEGGSEGRLLMITAEAENSETTTQPLSYASTRKTSNKAKNRKGEVVEESIGK